MGIPDLVEIWDRVQGQKIKQAQDIATSQFEQSRLTLQQQQAQQAAEHFANQVQQQQIQNTLAQQAQQRLEETTKETERHNKAGEATNAKKASTAELAQSSLNDWRKAQATYKTDRLGQIQDANDDRDYLRFYHDALTQTNGDPAAAEQLARANMHAIHLNRTVQPAPAPEPDPATIAAMHQQISQALMGVPKTKGQLQAEASRALTQQREMNTQVAQSTIERNDATIEHLDVDNQLKRAQTNLANVNLKAKQQQIDQNAIHFPLKLSDEATMHQLHLLEVSEKKNKVDVESALAGTPSPQQLADLGYVQNMKTALSTKFEKIGKAKADHEKNLSSIAEHVQQLRAKIKTVPIDQYGQRVQPNSPDWENWKTATGPDGMLTQNLAQATLHLAEANRVQDNLNRQYNQLEAVAKGKNGWIKDTSEGGKPVPVLPAPPQGLTPYVPQQIRPIQRSAPAPGKKTSPVSGTATTKSGKRIPYTIEK